MIIDAHVHVSPDAGPAGWERLIRDLKQDGAGMALVSSVGRFERYPQPDAVRRYNADSASFARGAGSFARWLAYINPQNDNWSEELDLCLREGAIGIKLWCALKDAGGGLDRTRSVVAVAAQRRLPVLMHTFSHTEGNPPGELNIEEFAALAAELPTATLVAAHAGGNWRQAIGALSQLPNASVDVCGSFPASGMVEALVADIGAERIVFGTDMPGRSFASQLAKVVLADIGDEEKELILWRNAARIFGLGSSDSPAGQSGQAGPCHAALAEAEQPRPGGLERSPDHFCFCGRWPSFETQCETPQALNALLAVAGVQKAYAADLGSMFRADLAEANRSFVQLCQACPRIAPLAIVNPRASNWRRVLAGRPQHAVGVLVSPYLHNWRLDEVAHMPLFEECARASVPLWVNCGFGDHRFRHSAMQYRPVAAEELGAFARQAPRNAYVLQALTWPVIQPHAETIRARTDFRIEISRLTDLYRHAEAAVSAGLLSQLVVGSEFPLRDLRQVRWTACRQGL
jgi:hypothetical protein